MRRFPEIHTAAELTAFVDEIGFLPLLPLGVDGWSVADVADEEAQYTRLPDGGWEWPLWEWKGSVIKTTGCAYGKFFHGKAGFISRSWWSLFCAYRRSSRPTPAAGSVEEMILSTLAEGGSMLTRELRAACDFPGKMRSQFDTYITRLEMSAHIVTEDFIYPRDRHNKPYGWGWSLLTRAESLLTAEACQNDIAPDEAYRRMLAHLTALLPHATEKSLARVLQ